MDIHDLWLAGRSTTRRAWLTNPIRNSLFSVARPYFVKFAQTIDKLSAIVTALATKADLADIEAKLRHHSDDIAASTRQGIAVKEELKRIGVLMDGLSKNQLAWANTLGGLDEGAERGRNAEAELHKQLLQVRQIADALSAGQHLNVDRIKSVEQHLGKMDQQIEALTQQIKTTSNHVDVNHAPTGVATLAFNQPIAVSGTSLVFSSGPYGCFLLRQPDLISDHILAGAFWDSHLKPVIERAARSNGSAIDAGAYLGFHSTYMSRFFRAVHAYEPQVEIYRMLCANLLLNNCRNVTAVNAALYDVPGCSRLADVGRQEIPLPVRDHVVDYDRIGNAAALSFQMTSPDDLGGISTRTIDQLGLTDLAFIKVDTQGSDLHVIIGARDTIHRCRPILAVEFENELARSHGNTLDDYYGYFEEMAYDVRVLDNRNDGKQIDLLATPR